MIIQRRSKPAHSVGVSVCVPHSGLVLTPTMTPLQVALRQGAHAKHRGREADENPYEEGTTLAEHWAKGHTG